MTALREEPHKLRRDSRPPSRMAAYSIVIALGNEVVSLTLREEPCADVLHAWSKAFDPDLNRQSQIVGLLQAALQDLDDALAVFKIRIKRVEARRDHVPLWNLSGQLTKLVVEGFHGGHYYHTLPGGRIDERLAEMEAAEFNRVAINCEAAR